MPKEIQDQENEMKFLVKNEDFINDSIKKTTIKQGYLNQDKERTVRIRIQDKVGYLTIKGKSEIINGVDTRYEWETEIDYDEALDLMELCTGIIHKDRYIVPIIINDEAFTIEVDKFKGLKTFKDLIVAEIEFSNNEGDFDITKLPNWIGDNITGKPEYYNSNLK